MGNLGSGSPGEESFKGSSGYGLEDPKTNPNNNQTPTTSEVLNLRSLGKRLTRGGRTLSK